MEEHLWWPPTGPLFGHSAPENEKHDAGDANGQILPSPENNNKWGRRRRGRRIHPRRRRRSLGRSYYWKTISSGLGGSIQDLFLFTIKLPESFF